MSSIFISYRHDDSASTCGRIYERLAAHFGREAVFKDVDDIPYGVRFPDYLAEQLRACRVELVIIGRFWLTLTTPDGIRRLDAPGDFVRTEIETGLRDGLLVIPVLVDNATIPRADDLPASIRNLVELEGAEIHYDPYFDTDMQRLIRQLERWLGVASATSITMPTGAPLAAFTERSPALSPFLTPTPATTLTAMSDAIPTTALIARLLPQIRAAYERREWHVVIDKADYLVAEAPDATPTEVYRMLGAARFATGDLAASLAVLKSVLARDGTDTPALDLAARACLQIGEFTDAATYLKRALALVSSDTDRLLLLPDYAEALARTSQWDELLRRCDEALRLRPGNVAWQRRRLTALQAFHRDAEALAALRTITASADATAGDWIARAQLAYAVANNTATDEVRVALDAAARISPALDADLAAARRELLQPPPRRVTLPNDRLPAKLAELGFAAAEQDGVAFILPPRCPTMPAGLFLMGSDPRRDPDAQASEQPAHDADVPAFQIARYPVTVAEYACFVKAGHAEPQTGAFSGVDWRTQLTRLDHPVTCVTWHDATAYAAWLAQRTGQPWRLPTEAEWEKAARWDAARGAARLYPWGDSFNKARCNTRASGIKNTTPVYAYPSGASPCGALDMAGNVWEWTSTLYQPYPYSQNDGREDQNSTENRVLRGGSWGYNARYARAAYRIHVRPDGFFVTYGFRLAVGRQRVAP